MDKALNIKETILKSVDGKMAKVDATGLWVNGSIEGKCLLRWSDTWGLEILVPLQWNSVDLKDIIVDTIRELKNNDETKKYIHGYDAFAVITKALSDKIDKTFVQAATISTHNIQEVKISVNDNNEISTLHVHYKESIVRIRIVK